jgi:hypothetical protein
MKKSEKSSKLDPPTPAVGDQENASATPAEKTPDTAEEKKEFIPAKEDIAGSKVLAALFDLPIQNGGIIEHSILRGRVPELADDMFGEAVKKRLVESGMVFIGPPYYTAWKLTEKGYEIMREYGTWLTYCERVYETTP